MLWTRTTSALHRDRRLAQNDGQTNVVTKGLSVGDRIVVEGVNKHKNDMEIKPNHPRTERQTTRKVDGSHGKEENARTRVNGSKGTPLYFASRLRNFPPTQNKIADQ